jgi:hypothetical protein
MRFIDINEKKKKTKKKKKKKKNLLNLYKNPLKLKIAASKTFETIFPFRSMISRVNGAVKCRQCSNKMKKKF